MGENLFLLSKAQSTKRWEKSKLTLEEPDKLFLGQATKVNVKVMSC